VSDRQVQLLRPSRDSDCAADQLARGQERHVVARQHVQVAYCYELEHPDTAVPMVLAKAVAIWDAQRFSSMHKLCTMLSAERCLPLTHCRQPTHLDLDLIMQILVTADASEGLSGDMRSPGTLGNT